jgi:sugar O-acyltransferase (sialic acid O-acetyltransferase NeuD family)
LRRLLIVGAGSHGRSIAESALLGGEWSLAGFIDDGTNPPDSTFGGAAFLGGSGKLAAAFELADAVIVAIGDNRVRERLHAQVRAAGFALATIRHPTAIVAPSSVIGPGCALMAGSVVGTEARLGEGVIVNSGSVVDHHCGIEDFGHVGTNACMAGGSVLGRRAWMQAGASLAYGVRVAADRVLAAGEALQGP